MNSNSRNKSDDNNQLVLIVEAALFAAQRPLSVDTIRQLFEEGAEPSRKEVLAAIEELKLFYQHRGIALIEVATGFRFQTLSSLSPWIQRLWEEKPPRMSRALLETLVLMAYRQPITRGEIEEVRGVAVSSQIVRTLIERGWVRIVGHKEVPGRPALYATTDEFLNYFNLKHLDELPTLAELQSMILEEEAAKEVEKPSEEITFVEATPKEEELEDELLAIDMGSVDEVLNQFETNFKENTSFVPTQEALEDTIKDSEFEA